MTPLFLIALSAAAQAPSDRPRTFLLSIDRLSIGADESVTEIDLETWGVEFRAVCHIPRGWRVEAGGNATPEGNLRARGTHGVTWLRRNRLQELRNLALVTLRGPVQNLDARVQNGVVPATFKGLVSIDGRSGRTAPLNHLNVRLTPANNCPR